MVTQRSIPPAELRQLLAELVSRMGSRREIARQAQVSHQMLANFLNGKTQKPHQGTSEKLTRLVTPSDVKPFTGRVPPQLQVLAMRKGLLAEDMIRMARARLKPANRREEEFWEELAVAIRIVPGIFDF